MSDPLVPQVEPNTQGIYNVGGGLTVQPLPDEAGVPLRRDDFLTLCEGEIPEGRANRDVCIGIACTAVVGILGVLAAVDWDTILKWGHFKIMFLLVLLMVLFIAASGSAVGAMIHASRVKRTLERSPYSRLKARLSKEYEAREAAQKSLETVNN